MEDPPNGRITSKEVYELLGRMEERLTARLDRLEDKLCERIENNETEITRVEGRINRQDGLVVIAAAVAAAVSAAIGWRK
jgi:hypothetical protein